MSSIVNKLKDALHPKEETPTTETTHTTNPATPRTDAATSHGAGATLSSDEGTYSSDDNYALGGNKRGADGPASHTDGPHSSNLMNKADPRVDSDRDHSKNLGANPHGTATTGDHTTGTTHGTTHSNTQGTTTHGTHYDTTHSTTGPAAHTAGPHSSDLANKADPRVDSDRDGSRNLGANPRGTGATTDYSTTSHSTHHAAGTGATTSEPQHGTHGTHTHGPHSSNLANKADPRVDSDRDGSRTMGANPQGTSTTKDYPSHTAHERETSGIATGAATGAAAGTGAAVAGHHGSHATHGAHDTYGTHGTTSEANRGFDGPASKTDGPHSSKIMNKMDPRVDSDGDRSKNLGANPQGTATTGSNTHSSSTHGTTTTHGTTGTTSGDAFFSGRNNTTHDTTGLSSTHGHGTHKAPEGSHGPHESRAANMADPRVDSDRDGSRNLGAAHTGTHKTAEGTHGPHESRVANAADPRVDSDRDGSRTMEATSHSGAHTSTHAGTHTGSHSGTHTGAHTGAHTGTHGTGPAPNTAGPHKSDILKKMDPRVDSNLDGSRTIGGNKTFDRSDETQAHKDPTDAAQVPPSVLQKHVGGVAVQHKDS